MRNSLVIGCWGLWSLECCKNSESSKLQHFYVFIKFTLLDDIIHWYLIIFPPGNLARYDFYFYFYFIYILHWLDMVGSHSSYNMCRIFLSLKRSFSTFFNYREGPLLGSSRYNASRVLEAVEGGVRDPPSPPSMHFFFFFLIDRRVVNSGRPFWSF